MRGPGFTVAVRKGVEALLALGPDVKYKYSGKSSGSYYEVAERAVEGEDLLVATVQEGERVIGYGIAALTNGEWNIEIIDVDAFSRRSTGLQRIVTIGGIEFGVGVGHVVVNALAPALKQPIYVDATGDASRYIFKSLGFVPRPGEQNPCLLQLAG